MTQPKRYSNTAILLHWLCVLVIIAAFPLGLYMHELPLSPSKLQLYSYHKWLGITLLLIVAARLAWRAGHRPPPLPSSIPRWQQRAAHGLHGLLYLLMLAIPLSGWLMSSAKGFQTVYLGLLPLPDLVGKDKILGEQLAEIHEMLNFMLMSLVFAHVGAALKHHFIDRDSVLSRMLPFLNGGKRP